jgi:aspartyl aminopeptidase
MDKNFTNLYNEVKNILSGETINLVNISSLLIHLMESVQKIKGLSGEEKKKLVLEVLKYTIDESDLSSSEKKLLGTLCETLIPETINTIISVANNEFDLKKIENCFSCFKFK